MGTRTWESDPVANLELEVIGFARSLWGFDQAAHRVV
jgi:hypothetical protein